VRLLQNERDDQVATGVDCEGIDLTYRTVKALHTARMKADAQTERRTDLLARLSAAQADLARLLQTIAIQEANIAVECADQCAALARKHEDEVEALAREWESEPKIRLFNRSSGSLLQLRLQANTLLNQHRYDEMGDVTQQADRVQAVEAQAGAQRWQQSYEEGVRLMQRRHAMEKRKLARVQEEKRAAHGAAKAFDTRVARQRIRVIEIELEAASDPEKLWNLRHRFDPKALGKKPRAKSGRGAGRRAFRIEEFNTLDLPPLLEWTRTKREEWTVSVATQQFQGRDPKYVWL
jgi:hypothetical protein